MPANRDLLERVVRSFRSDANSISHLGTGGFASTFAVTNADGATTAIKILDPTLAQVERIERELAALSRVDHPNVVHYRDVGSYEFEGVQYRWIEMDFVEGRSLARRLQDGEIFDLSAAVGILRGIVAGAAAIWAEGTAHRDLSPNNVLVTSVGDAVIVDLGLARHVDDETITILPSPGTPGWMSPEQVGPSPTHGDWRSDQFVLGLIGYVLITGVFPFQALNRIDMWLAPANQTPRPVRAVDPNIPTVVADVVERMLAPKPHRRYLQPTVLLADLDRAASALAIASTTTTDAPRFYLCIGQRKNFVTTEFLGALHADGVVVDAQARSRISELSDCAAAANTPTAVDPVTYLSRSPLAVRPAGYQKLVHGQEPVLTGFSDDDQRAEWCREVLAAQMDYSANVVITPYFFAAHAELSWVQESLACASTTANLVAQMDEANRPEVWTGLAVASSWLHSEAERDDLLSAITGQPMSHLYLLVATNQPTFGPLADTATLEGFRDLIQVMREANVPVIVGRRASSGLLLLALGATACSYGVTGNLMNMQPHPEVETDGGPGYDRVYVPQLLNHITAPIYDLMRRHDADRIALDTEPGCQLIADNPTLEELTTEQRVLLTQHNVLALRGQATDLSYRPAAQRLTTLRQWVADARANYASLPPTRLPGEGPEFLAAWEAVL